MNNQEVKLRSERAFNGRIFDVDVDNVLLPDGSRSVRECVRHPGGAAVLFIKDGKVALVGQFRYLYGVSTLEIPAGRLEKGEDPACAALRELEEETGYRAENCRHLIDLYPTPGYTDEIIHIYFVDGENAKFVGERPDEGEFLNVTFVPLDDLINDVRRGKINDAKTVCAVLMYESIKRADI